MTVTEKGKRAIRKAMKPLSQAALARSIGISENHLSAVLNGRVDISKHLQLYLTVGFGWTQKETKDFWK